MIYNFFMNINEIFSINLIRFRKLRCLSQRELARKTGLTLRMINHYENNPKSVPMDKLKILADTLNIKISYLFNEEEGENPLDNIDIRWIKKIYKIKNLSQSDRKEINRYINYLTERSKSKDQN